MLQILQFGFVQMPTSIGVESRCLQLALSLSVLKAPVGQFDPEPGKLRMHPEVVRPVAAP